MNLTKLAIERPVFILMLMLAAVLAGVVGYQSMRVEENPEVNFGVVTVQTVYPGAGPDEVNTLISKKIEESVSGVNNINEMLTSSLEGVSVVRIQFKIGTDMDAALNEVRSKVDRTVPQLPRDAERPVVEKIDTASEPIMTVAVRSESLSNRQLRDLADRSIKDRLLRINGVASVAVSGGDVREIQVRIRRDALLRYGVGVLDVQRAIQSAAVNVPSGRIVDGGTEFTVRMLGEFRRVEELADMSLSISDGRGPMGVVKSVRLGDLADVRDANRERRELSRLNGDEAVIMVIQKSREGNAVEISKALRKPDRTGSSLLQKMEKDYGVNFVVSLDTSTRIVESIEDLNFSIVFGIILVTLTVWVFLHNLRGTIIVALAIPICLMATIAALWVFGFTINNLSMLALSLAIGVLVDDAIVIIENIYRHLTMGEEPVEAAIKGRAEIGLAAIAITLADVVVFLPIGTMGGVSGQFFRPLGLGYAVCVLFSLLVSFTVTPMLAARWYRKGEDWEHPKGRFSNWFEGRFRALAESYGRGLKRALNRRWYVFGFGFAVLFAVFMFIGGSFVVQKKGFMEDGMGAAMIGSTFFMFCVAVGVLIFLGNLIFRRKLTLHHLMWGVVFGLIFPMSSFAGYSYRNLYKKEDVFKGGFFPSADQGLLAIKLDMPPGTSLDETTKIVDRLEKITLAHPEVHFAVTTVGTRGGGFSALDQGSNYAEITATLYEKKAIMDRIKFWEKHEERLREVSVDSVAADLVKSIGRIPGAKLSIAQPNPYAGGAAIQLSLQSDNRELLSRTARTIRDRLLAGEVEGLVNADIATKVGKPELRVVPNRAKLAELDVTAASMGQAIRTLYEGDDQAKFRVRGEEYDIRVMMDLLDRNDTRTLEQVPVTFLDNKPVFLSDVATIERGEAVDRIDRRNRNEEALVTADLLAGFLAGSTQAKIDAWLVENKLIPEGVTYKAVGQAQVQSDEQGYLLGALLTGIVLVYMLLASLYNNVLYPFIIQLSQPQALVGALLALMITDKGLNVVGFIGIVALLGLVGKNAILLVDYANTLRERGEQREQALVDSGRTRLRPILMTTIALLVGTLPVALAIGRGSEFRETIGITIIGGAVLSTLLTLFVIPCSYTIFDDLSQRLGKLMNRRRPEGAG